MGRKQAQDSPGTLHTLVCGVKLLRVMVVVGRVWGNADSPLKKILQKDATYLCGWVSDVLLKTDQHVSETICARE